MLQKSPLLEYTTRLLLSRSIDTFIYHQIVGSFLKKKVTNIYDVKSSNKLGSDL